VVTTGPSTLVNNRSRILAGNPDNQPLQVALLLKVRANETICGRVSKLFINFKQILSLANGNFEEQNKVLESSIN
jgi:hypothetical protein